ncbi:MAG: hypothetical protein J0H56_00700 [Micrococcales bacterium]|nr:hypothetical protein [Micrococcales bacterium]
MSLPPEAVAFLDEQTRSGVYPPRSAALSAAVTVLREASMTDSYAAARDEWERSGEDALGESVAGDGVASSS